LAGFGTFGLESSIIEFGLCMCTKRSILHLGGSLALNGIPKFNFR